MSTPHPALTQLSGEFAAISSQLNQVAWQLTRAQQLLAAQLAAPVPAPVPAPAPAPAPVPVPVPVAVAPPTQPRPVGAGGTWLPKLLAAAGVGVTLIGVALLLVLAAQAGLLRPEIRVVAGGALAAALVGAGVRLFRRPGGRTGAIALVATGVAAAYIDIVAVTTIYQWVPPAVGLLLATLVGAAGLVLVRRWDSQELGVLVLVPLLVLAPVVAGGVTLLLIGLMIALSAAALPIQLGRDWNLMFGARTAAVTVPLLVALAVASFGSGDDPRLIAAACAVAALLTVVGAVLVAAATTNRVALALWSIAGAAPVLLAGAVVERVLGALLAGVLSAGLLAVITAGRRLPGVSGPLSTVWAALSAVSAVVAVTLAFDGQVAAPVLLALAVAVAAVGRNSALARWAATGFAIIGALLLTVYVPIATVLTPTQLPGSIAAAALAGSVLMGGCAVLIAATAKPETDDQRSAWWGMAAVVSAYSVTLFTVTAGVLLAGPDSGFRAGHMVATIWWIVVAAGLFAVAQHRPRDSRTAPIAGGLALTAAAMAKLFLFDLGALDGMFRVAAFIVVGLVLLGMGAGYARALARQDDAVPDPVDRTV